MWSFTTAVKRIDFESESGVWYLWTGTLREDAKAKWDVLEEALRDGTELNIDQLQLLMREWIAVYAADSDRAQQIEYDHTVKKPLNIDCKAFLLKLRNLNTMADLLPGTALVLDDDSLKRCFFNAMPSSWQTRFEHMGCNFETTEIKDLSQYFSAQERLASAKAKLTSLRQKKDVAKNGDGNGNGKKRGKNRRGKRGNGNKRDRADNDTSADEPKSKKQRIDAASGTRIADTAPCPIHPGTDHQWIDCNTNKYNCKSRSNTGKPSAKKDKSFIIDTVSEEAMMADESPRWGSEAAVDLTKESTPTENTQEPSTPEKPTGKTSILESLCCTADCTDLSHHHMHHLSCFTLDDLQSDPSVPDVVPKDTPTPSETSPTRSGSRSYVAPPSRPVMRTNVPPTPARSTKSTTSIKRSELDQLKDSVFECLEE
jgi:hypothetical protein